MRKLLIVACLGFCSSRIAVAETPATSDLRSPVAVAAHLNHDGIPDLVTGNALGLFVQLGIGDGSFHPTIQVSDSNYSLETDSIFATGHTIAFGDFNGDGNPDIALVACNQGNCSLAVLLGNGDGTFQPQRAYDPSGAIVGIAVGDFNGDGILDIALANYGNGTVDLLLGNGDGSFQPARPIARAGASSLAADLNGKGGLDLVIADWDASTVQVLRNDGHGNFQPGEPLPTGPNPSNLTLADLRGTGRLDIVTLDSNYAVSVLLKNSDGTFEPATTVYTADSQTILPSLDVQGLAVADVYGSGIPALVLADESSSAVEILAGNGDGSFQDPVLIPVGAAPSALDLADLNHDGRPDLIVTSRTNSTTILLNQALRPPALAHAPACDGACTSRNGVTAHSASPTFTLSALPGTTIPWGKPLRLRLTLTGSPALLSTRMRAASYTIDNGPAGLADLATGSATVAVSQLSVGSHNIIVSHARQANYMALEAHSLTVTVTQATPQLTWSNPASIPYGTALGDTQLNATAPIAGTFVYTPAAGTVLSAGSHTLSVTFTPTDTTDYTTATATVSQLVGPEILSQPASLTVVLGHSAAFSVAATGAGPLAYQWQYWTGTAWSAFVTGTGYTTKTFVTAATTAASSGTQIRALVTDANGVSAASNAATLTVSPIVTTQPSPQTVPVGNSATFTVVADGVASFTYQWQSYSYASATWSAVTTGTGFNTAAFTTQPTAVADNASAFRVVVTDGNGLAVTSLQAKLAVAPAILTQPVSQIANDGASATFTVAATGVPNLGYRWQYWTGTAWTNYTTAQGYNTPTLTIRTAAIPLNGLQLQVVVNDSDGLTVTSNQVTLTVAPIITTQPTHQTEPVNWSATFSVVALGVPTLTYQWQYLNTASAWQPFTNCSICNAATLVTNANKITDNGTQLRVVVTDGNGLTVTSNTVTLTVIL